MHPAEQVLYQHPALPRLFHHADSRLLGNRCVSAFYPFPHSVFFLSHFFPPLESTKISESFRFANTLC